MISSIIKRKANEIRLSKRGDRRNAFRIHRFKNDHGFQVYTLENTAEGNKIFIPRFIFGRFRATLRMILNDEINGKKPEPFEHSAAFLNREYFYFKSSSTDIDNLIIQDIEEREGSSGYITVSRRCLHILDQLLYSDKLQHPNDVLQEIISYHKLFQFSFVKGSKSITSDLALRKDVLQHIERYTPSLAQKVNINIDSDDADKKPEVKTPPGKRDARRKAEANLYKPKLGERINEKDIRIDYDEVFGDTKVSLAPAAANDDAAESKSTKAKSILSEFAIPLSASEVKTFETGKFYFELSAVESSVFRDRFINDRSCDFYLGFEIVDALFTFNRTIKTFRFPLYYTRVRIRESGRGVYLESRQDGQIYLNHLALAHLVDKFSDAVAGVDHVDKFFKTLLAQDISVDRLNDRIHLTRQLPVKESIFDRTREILFGYQDENGKGGILADLKVKGIECDLQSVYLYRAPKLLNPIDQALELDLDQITAIAHHSTRRFYDSLLGKFLTPEQQTGSHHKDAFAPIVWMPGALPQSTRHLVDRLSHHDLVLLEGPPGTGKTFTIMNLLLHCINSKQRVLIVSDQKAAIEALIEKLQEYLVGNDQGTPAERKWKDLLFSAIKVVDEVQTGDHALQDLVNNLTEAFKVQDLPPGSATRGENLEKKIKLLGEKIEKIKAQIGKKMFAYMSDDVAFDQRILKKDDGHIDTQSLLEFLGIVQGNKTQHRQLIDAFVQNRFNLIKDNMQECYNFFKIPGKNFDTEVKTLKDDEKILSLILQNKPVTPEAFQEITREYPRHEIIRYLEALMQSRHANQGNALSRQIKKIVASFRPPLQVSAAKLLRNVQDQIALLKMSDSWSAGLWDLLKDMHEAIRIGDTPNRALSLYRSISRQSAIEVGVDPARDSSIQGDLEQIDDLFKQQDALVRERLVENLRDIVQSATASKRGSGTSNMTSIMALADSLKQFNSISESGSVFDELRQKLFETFPIWVVRKQTVPFLLPCVEQSFDLVIVDEATQCRVDDAMSLMFRAKRMLVVGDDKQTVLQKNSVIDDYLFKDHELDEHLRSTQARGFKGGGSHIFALVQAIKQASIMLDEHYRCPGDIIEFSNKYVYGNELNIMQWRLPEHASAVDVDFSEQKIETSKKATSGKFKGIETDMVDRYMQYVVDTVKKIEKSTGKKINMETDVALCYFLLKNEPYVKHIKDKYLSKLNRGDDVLDGAGAALQGKERDYIFYLWDVTRFNMGAFKQGDDADKRKGELNVLMSRPKKKAFHYLHRSFDQLEHGRTNITSYLWKAYVRQQRGGNWNTSTQYVLNESLLGSLLKFTLANSSKRGLKEVRQNIQAEHIEFREDIIVGDAGRVVDLIAYPTGAANNVVGLVDLSGFGCENNVGQAVVDYFFQLKRVSPGIEPVFIFPHELIDENGQTFRSLMHRLEHMDTANIDDQPQLKNIK
ncbi:MAG TPA: AAA domain-containing protein [Gammaproteobacteria bacterium]